MEKKFEMVAKTFKGLEDVLRDELLELGAENVEIGNRMVSFEGDLELLYKANLCCRTALRILKPIVKFTADTPDELYDYVRELDWEQFMTVDSTFSIDSTVNSAEFTHSKYVTYRVKDGIADHFNDKYGRRPSIRLNGADLQLDVHIADNRVTISLNSSGESLSKRGYRVAQTEAPINEVLAAGIIMKTGWRGDCDFVDPMCGSGTFLIEAALIAANINPGIYREQYAFEKWTDFDEELFEELYNDDSGERSFAYSIMGGDNDPDAIAASMKNIKSAKVEEMVKVFHKPLTQWEDNAPEGVLVTNPPYGERLKPENLNNLYKSIGSTLKNYFKGWHAWVIGPDDDIMDEIGLKPSVKIPLFNSNIECTLREYVMFDGKYSEFRADGGEVTNHRLNREKQVPKKIRHISEDEWKKETRKFNNRDSRKERKPRRDDDRSFRRNEERDNRFGRNDRDKEERRFDRNDCSDSGFKRNFNERSDNRFSRDNRDKGERRFERNDSRDNRFNRNASSDNRFSRSDRDHRGAGNNRERSFDRNERPRPGGGVNYNPANSKGPRLPESSSKVINPVHMRSRRQKPDAE